MSEAERRRKATAAFHERVAAALKREHGNKQDAIVARHLESAKQLRGGK